MKKQTIATTREIGDMLGKMSYAATAKMYQRITKEIAENKGLRKKMEEIRKSMSYVEG